MSKSIIKENIWDRDRANGYIFPYYDGDKIGIGTETPAELLDVRDGAIRVGYDTDTFDQLLEFYRSGNKIGVIDNSGGDLRLKANFSNSVQVINSNNIGIQITDADVIDVVGVPTMSVTLQGLISHTNITDIGTNTHPQIDTHIADTTIHFTEASIDHLNIQNIGTNSHATIDTHIASTSNPHSTTFLGLGDTPGSFTAGSVLFTSGTAVTEDNANLFWDDSSNKLGIGTNAPASKLDVAGGVKIADDTDTCDSTKAGTLRYNVVGNNSYCDMCMQTGASTYSWQNVVQNNW